MIRNVADLLRSAAASTPEAVALVETEPARRELTWSDLDAAVDGLARALTGRGLRAGHRVALVAGNRIDMVVAYLATVRGGMVAVPVNPRADVAEVARMLGESGARVVVADQRGAALVREAGLPGVELVVAGGDPGPGERSLDDLVAGATASTPMAPQDAEARAAILFTSGRGGPSRGAILTHRALLANIEQLTSLQGPTSEDVLLGLLPLHHVYGLNVILGQVLHAGARLVLVDGFRSDALLRTIADEGVTILPIAPPVVAAWAGRPDLREALSGVRSVVSGAGVLEPELADAFAASSGHVIEQGYGHTEAGPVIASTLVGAHERPAGAGPRPGRVGRPLPGVELEIVEDRTRPAEPGDPGEIRIRGANLFSGYWPDGADGPDVDGWYLTGDVGYLDEDGELVVRDRLNELVVVSGFSVYPSEVEEVLAGVAGVQEVAVVGTPSASTGQAVVAFVVAADGLADDVVVERVREAAAGSLARFKQPSEVVVVHDLPRSSGAVAKGRLRAMARSETLGLGAEPTS